MEAPGAGDWFPTHTAPTDGLAAWETPDPEAPSAYTLPPGSLVQVLSESTGWAEIMTEGRWVGWVDRARLVDIPPPGLDTDTPPAEPPSPSETSAVPQGENKLSDALRNLEKPGKGPLLALVAVVAAVLTSNILWPLLGIPGNLLNTLVPSGDCTGETPGTFRMYTCSAWVGLLQLLGGIISLMIVIAFRKPLQAQLQRVLPSEGSSIVTPVLATALFGLFYASTHSDTASQSGIVSQRMFPAVVGLLAFGGVRFGRTLASRFQGAISKRDSFSGPVRLAIAFGLPMFLAYASMNQDRVTDTAMKEQLVVLTMMLLGYAAFLPSNGDIVSVLRSAASRWFGRLSRSKEQSTGPTIERSES